MGQAVAVLACSLIGTLALVGCVPPPTYSPTPYQAPSVNPGLENLRTLAMDSVAKYAQEMGTYTQANGIKKGMEAGQAAVKTGLKDPMSAQFRNLRIVDYAGGKVVCGDVNAKNSYGGYVGFKPFAAGTSGATILDTDGRYADISDAANAGIVAACSP